MGIGKIVHVNGYKCCSEPLQNPLAGSLQPAGRQYSLFSKITVSFMHKAF
jgi:hypothetical protein